MSMPDRVSPPSSVGRPPRSRMLQHPSQRSALVGGLDGIPTVPPGRAARPDAASSVAPVPFRYERSLRPCLGTAIAPRRRALFRQTLLATEPGFDPCELIAGYARGAEVSLDAAVAPPELLEHTEDRLGGRLGDPAQ